jgi:hypothetical protein
MGRPEALMKKATCPHGIPPMLCAVCLRGTVCPHGQYGNCLLCTTLGSRPGWWPGEANGGTERARPDRYGDYTLTQGDNDMARRWGGTVHPASAAQPAGQGYVFRLQQDLLALGFRLFNNPTGTFDLATYWALREFQAYAKMEHAAQENTQSTATRYVDRLAQIVIPQANRYTGRVSGVLNQRTRQLLQHWVDNRWRCPVVAEAWNMQGNNRSTLAQANVWRHDEVPAGRRVYVRDFTEYYDFPADRNRNDLIVLGARVDYLNWAGPVSKVPQHTWREAEMLPERLVGVALAQLTTAQRSTYKVVRAVSEVECMGFFDSVNAYDNAFISLGPCHWTLGIVNNGNQDAQNVRIVEEGELCGFLAYLRQADAASFEEALGFFGLRVDEAWGTNGQALYNAAQRKYTGWVALEQENGTYQRVREREPDANYLKTWHWFYRYVMAGRTITGFQRRMWHLARTRLRDLRRSAWGAGVAAIPLGPPGQTRPATVGDVFTSEKAMGIILRWHIRFPGHILTNGQAATRLRNALQRARVAQPALGWTGAPTTWTPAHETALIQGLRDEVASVGNDNLDETITYVNGWPTNWGNNPRGYALPATIGALAEGRNSFLFDDSELPPAL